MSVAFRSALLALTLTMAEGAAADELRLLDGEILYGTASEVEKGRISIVTAEGSRTIRARDVAEVIEGEAPQAELARREAELTRSDADGRVTLARFAWSRRLDADARRLAVEALALDPEHALAHLVLGHAATPGGWVEGWPAAWAPAGSVGSRWGPGRRRAKGGAAKAIAAALSWLAAHQDEDGTVDADGFGRHCPEGDRCPDPGGGHHGERVPCAFDGVTTAVAVMAWLAEGSTPTSGPYAEPVRRGLARCVAELEQPRRGFDTIWNRAYAVQAVADAYAVSRESRLGDVLFDAVAGLLAEQRPDGGWSYIYAIGDVPTTATVLGALGMASQAGVGVDPALIERALAFLEARVDPKTRRSEYHDGAERKGYTPTTANAAATLAARAAVGMLRETPALGARLAALTAKKPKWKISFEEVKTRDGRTVRAQVGNLYPYAWYHAAFALAAAGKASGGWSKALRATLAEGQDGEGHAAGSWEPLGPYSTSGGRAFVTGICTLMLQAPYRYPRER